MSEMNHAVSLSGVPAISFPGRFYFHFTKYVLFFDSYNICLFVGSFGLPSQYIIVSYCFSFEEYSILYLPGIANPASTFSKPE